MYSSTSYASPHLHELLVESHTRRLLFQDSIDHQSPTNSPVFKNNHNSTGEFDSHVVMIIAVLLCAFICSLALHFIIRFVLRFSNVAINNDSSSSSTSSSNNNSPQLVNKGIKNKALKKFPIMSYSTELNLSGLDTDCVICLSEFIKDEKVRILPKCNHGFHVCCIDKWLEEHSSCPKCRQCLLETCQKIGGSQVQPIELAVPETIIRIQPQEPEALESNHTEI